ncbi:MAG: hypothetical protein JOZ26_14040, partial [Hyphomicrobiales bacterium]|nr:hypothetical protein [Hyphomicrobiales bacterium]
KRVCEKNPADYLRVVASPLPKQFKVENDFANMTDEQLKQQIMARTHKSGSVCAGSLNVRFAPKATELLRRREMSRWANCGTSMST